MNAMCRSYLETALFATTAMISEDDSDESWQAKNYDVSDFAPEAIAYAQGQCDDFVDMCHRAGLSDAVEAHAEQAGGDFWLTAEGHGAGFWDGDWVIDGVDLGDKLTKISKWFSGLGDGMYLDDAGMIHFSGDVTQAEWNAKHAEVK